jgi:hypothetical protein
MSTRRDPTIKQQIRDAILEALFARPRKELKDKLDKIAVTNAVSGGYSHASFLYKGEAYTASADRKWPRPPNRLLPKHRPEMEEWLSDKLYLEQEVPQIQTYLTLALNASGSFEDVLRLVPESLHPSIRELEDSASFRGSRLPDERVQELLSSHQHAIKLMKRRMALNLLI